MTDNNKKKKSALLPVLLVLLLTGLVGTVSAKYIFSEQIEALFRIKEFYFRSDVLTEEGAERRRNFDADYLMFELYNSADELRFSEDDVEYTISVEKKVDGSWQSGGALFDLYLDSDETADVTDQPVYTGTLGGGQVNEVRVKMHGLEDGAEYKVTAYATMGRVSGTNGFQKTISATFVPGAEGESVYKHLQKDGLYNSHVVLTVWTQNIKSDSTNGVVVRYADDDIVPDNTNPVLGGVVMSVDADDNEYIEFSDTTNFTQPYSSYSYRFFISPQGDIDNITVDDFVVTLHNGAVTRSAGPGTP